MAAAAIVVVPVCLHKKQSQIPARINQNNTHKEPNFFTNCSEECSTQKKTRNTQARIKSNFHARNFFKKKTNCTDMMHANPNLWFICNFKDPQLLLCVPD
jgi:hypothetical protein